MKEFVKEYKPAIFMSIIALIMIMLCVYNRPVVDLTYSYDYAYVELPTGEVVEGKVDSCRDYEDGDQLQVVIDGRTYLTNSTRIVLVKF